METSRKAGREEAGREGCTLARPFMSPRMPLSALRSCPSRQSTAAHMGGCCAVLVVEVCVRWRGGRHSVYVVLVFFRSALQQLGLRRRRFLVPADTSQALGRPNPSGQLVRVNPTHAAGGSLVRVQEARPRSACQAVREHCVHAAMHLVRQASRCRCTWAHTLAHAMRLPKPTGRGRAAA